MIFNQKKRLMLRVHYKICGDKLIDENGYCAFAKKYLYCLHIIISLYNLLFLGKLHKSGLAVRFNKATMREAACLHCFLLQLAIYMIFYDKKEKGTRHPSTKLTTPK